MRRPRTMERREAAPHDEVGGGLLGTVRRARNRRRRNESRVHMAVYVCFFLVLLFAVAYLLVIAAPSS